MRIIPYRWPQIDIVSDEHPPRLRVSVSYSYRWPPEKIREAVDAGIEEFMRKVSDEVFREKGMTDWTKEREDVLRRFQEELSKATGDGSKKRQSGVKPPWYRDGGHEGAIFSHLTKWKRGEKVDPDSGAHPLVHAAWRCLAIALIESGNTPQEEALDAIDIGIEPHYSGTTLPPGTINPDLWKRPGRFLRVDGNPNEMIEPANETDVSEDQ